MIFFFILIALPLLFSVIEFFGFLLRGKRVLNIAIFRAVEIASFLILPYLYATIDTTNDCCGESTAFSPQHQITILVIVILCLAAYFYSTYRRLIATPVVEVIVNSFLVAGIILNIVIAIQTKDTLPAVLGNVPVILLAILVLAKNQNIFIEQSKTEDNTRNKLETFAWKILNLKPLIKYPVIFILFLPFLFVITAILLLVGQKPDSIIRAFTDTYKHGFSQWDYKCDNVQCGGHYLCSVAANGHSTIVRPQRRGYRNGHNIICNRQLLISNAFEDLIQEKIPFCHRLIRRNYNKVGIIIHKYFYVFNDKLICDIIYVLMKPLEWFFLFTLYTFDKKPENRIAKQYLNSIDRKTIDKVCL